MSIKALDWAMDAPVQDPLAKLVLIVVANHHNDARGVAWPSVGHICYVTGAAERTVRAKLKKLEQAGFLIRNHRSGRSTEYTPAYLAPLHQMQDTPAPDAPITLKEPLKRNKGKTKVIDWEPDGKDRAFAESKGLDAAEVLEAIRLWDKQNGNKAAYVDLSAFWQNWCIRDAKKKPKRATGYSRPFNGQSSEWTPPQRKMVTVDQWVGFNEGMRDFYRKNRPDVIAELKKVGADV